jgi:UDP-glucose 4-epimerase
MIDLAASRILVTGADGLVGHAIAHGLARQGAQVTSVGKGTDLPGAVAVDLANADWPAEGCAAIVHCAARLPARFDGPEAEAADRENQCMDARALAAAADHKAHLVYFSSGSVYGDTAGLIDDTTPVRPAIGYARQKLGTEAEIDASGMPATVFRLVAPYGPRQRRRTVLKLFLEAALAGQPLEFYGSGARTQDFLHVDDIAAAVMLAITLQAQGCFVLAAGAPVTMRELAELSVKVTGSAGSVAAAGLPDPEETRQVRYDVSPLRTRLGLPEPRTLEAGLREWVALRRQETA